jgi:hypothetical protein
MWLRTLLQNEKPPSDQPKEVASGNSRSCRHLRCLPFFIDRCGTMVAYREMTTQQITEEASDWVLLVNIMPRLPSPTFSPGHLLPPAGGSFFWSVMTISVPNLSANFGVCVWRNNHFSGRR